MLPSSGDRRRAPARERPVGFRIFGRGQTFPVYLTNVELVDALPRCHVSASETQKHANRRRERKRSLRRMKMVETHTVIRRGRVPRPGRPYGPRVGLGGLSACCGTISARSVGSSTTARDRGRELIGSGLPSPLDEAAAGLLAIGWRPGQCAAPFAATASGQATSTSWQHRDSRLRPFPASELGFPGSATGRSFPA